MFNLRNIFISIVLMFIFVAPFIAQAEQRLEVVQQNFKWNRASIAVVLNESAKNIQLSCLNIKESVYTGRTVLKQRFLIPFVSMKFYMHQILNNTAYVPKEALRITTKSGRFGIWEDERGVQSCKLGRDLFGEEAVESLLTKDRLSLALSLTLKVNKIGALSIMSAH